MKKFFQQQRELIALLAYGLVIFAIVYFAIFPLMNKINEVNNQVQEETLNQEIVKKHIEELPRIQKQYDNLNSGPELTEVLLDNTRAVVLIEKLENLAQQSGNVINITVQEVAGTEVKKSSAKLKAGDEVPISDELPNQSYLRLKIILSGKYDSIISFMGALEKFEYYGDIIGIQMTKDNEKNSAQSSGISMGAGISNPFSTSIKDFGAIMKNTENRLNASLDVAFYLKKN